jgi:hypothetical protein
MERAKAHHAVMLERTTRHGDDDVERRLVVAGTFAATVLDPALLAALAVLFLPRLREVVTIEKARLSATTADVTRRRCHRENTEHDDESAPHGRIS